MFDAAIFDSDVFDTGASTILGRRDDGGGGFFGDIDDALLIYLVLRGWL